jgi:hypothetical protein
MLIALLAIALVLWTYLLIRIVVSDGLGWRPAPRSHADELSDTTWPR